jgi:RNA-directed DNA polymerase
MGSRINPYYSEDGKAVYRGKGLTEYGACKGNTVRTWRAGETVRTSLQGIANKAKADPKHRFQDLFGMIDKEMLLDSWKYLNKNAARGVDKVSAQEYEQNLVGNVECLVERLKEKRYRAKLVRRQYIPKANGKLRPLGIPAIEDKLLQCAVSRILTAIYEQDFLSCSFGYREGVGARDAVKMLTYELLFGRYGYVVEADIKGFFDHMSHEWIERMLKERIDDASLIWLIRKWLKAGVLDTDGTVVLPEMGSPQGGIISPVLSNLYLHYALDLWFEKVAKPRCLGDAYLCRYADDYVCLFRYKEDAERFFQSLGPRMGKFGLELASDKTRILSFSRFRKEERTCFAFLGFEFRWGVGPWGGDMVVRRTSPKKFRLSLANLTTWCKTNRHLPLKRFFRILNAKLLGYFNYYGVVGNFDSMNRYFYEALRMVFKWHNRRSQHRSKTWSGFMEMLKHFKVPKPRIVERLFDSKAACRA